MLWEEMGKYTKLTGEDATHVPIMKLGAYLDGYDKGIEILDKIRAEIETKYGQCKLTEYIVQYDGICTSVNDIGDIADILQIIDKYKAETEENNGNNNH